jgi:hypothetical protein
MASSPPPTEGGQRTLTLAVSGTRNGMTDAQRVAFCDLLDGIPFQIARVRHGDCIGVDADAHKIVRSRLGDATCIHIHPPRNKREHAACEQTDGPTHVHPDDDFLKRDRAMVDASDVVMAFPRGFKEQPRGSGTWVVIRYAKKKRVPLHVVFPDGRVESTPKVRQDAAVEA